MPVHRPTLAALVLAPLAFTVACRASAPSPAATATPAAAMPPATASSLVPYDVKARGKSLCWTHDYLPVEAVRLDVDGRYAIIHYGDLHDVSLYDSGRWSQPEVGTLFLDSDRYVPAIDVGSLSVDRMNDADAAKAYPALRGALASFLASHPEASFEVDDVIALAPKTIDGMKGERVRRADVAALLQGVERQLASKTPHRVVAHMAQYRGRTLLARSDGDPSSLAELKAQLDAGNQAWFEEIDASRCRYEGTP